MRLTSVELSRLARLQHDVHLTDDETEPTVNDVHPLVPLVMPQRRLLGTRSRRHDLLERLHAVSTVRQRHDRATPRLVRPDVDTRITRRRSVHDLVERDPQRPRNWQQQIQVRTSAAGLEP